MDTSNPVIPNDRRSIADLLRSQTKRRRQDLAYLGGLVATAEKVTLPVFSPVLHPAEVQDLIEQYKKKLPVVKTEKTEPIADSLYKVHDSVHISHIVGDDGMPLHPPNVNNAKGRVSVRRVMGGVPNPPFGFVHLVQILGDKVLDVKHVYTNGTWSGFMKRLKEQTGRKVVSIHHSYSQYWQNPKLSVGFLFKQLDLLMPRGPPPMEAGVPKWPKLNSELNSMLALIKVTGKSSAGAPYWQLKAECMLDILNTGLPIVTNAIKDGKLNLLCKENPELFLVEVKNKLDRYEIAKLDDKTRPYGCVPAHFSLLASILTQRFQESLLVFTDDPSSANAYGFSASKGGLRKLYEWMMSAPTRGKFICYGDDCRLAVRRPDGIYIVDPDFQQMDGSLAQADMYLVIDWIIATLEREDGEQSGFWRTFASVWKYLVSDPLMIVDGTAVYRKKKPNGLLSGVPGTTLFDTVKSIMSWNLYLDSCERDGHDPLDGDHATKFMAQRGLVIKPGTWQPAKVPRASPGILLTDHKFLGVQIKVEEYKGALVFVPHVPLEEALEMLVVQKDDPHEARTSPITKARTLFDRMRGLYITVGFNHPLIEDAIHNVVNNLDSKAIVMSVSAGSDRPDSILYEDFDFPDSCGFPTREFCLSLFSEEPSNEGWIYIFPTLVDVLDGFQKEPRYVDTVRRELEFQGHEHDIDGPILYSPMFEPVAPEEIEQEIAAAMSHKTFDVLDSPANTFTLPPKLNAMAHIASPDGNTTLRTYPKAHEVVQARIERDKVMSVREATRGIREGAIRKVFNRAEVFVTGLAPDDIVSEVPIQTPGKTPQLEIASEVAAQPTTSKTFKRALESLKTQLPGSMLATAPTELTLDPDFVDVLDKLPEAADITQAVQSFPIAVSKNTLLDGIKWITSTHQGLNPVGVRLLVRLHLQDQWVPVGYCRSISAKLAKQYLVAAIYAQKGVKIHSDTLSLQLVPPPTEYQDTGFWADSPLPPPPEHLALFRDPIIEVKPAFASPRHLEREIEIVRSCREISETGHHLVPPTRISDDYFVDRALETPQITNAIGKLVSIYPPNVVPDALKILLSYADSLVRQWVFHNGIEPPPDESGDPPSQEDKKRHYDSVLTFAVAKLNMHGAMLLDRRLPRPSRRGQLSAEQRTRLNRKTTERRRRKLANARTP